MPFQQVNVAGIAPIGNPALRNLSQSLMQGMQAMNTPTKMQQGNEAQRLANALTQARTGKMERESQMPFGGKLPPGVVGQSVWLDMIKNQYGEDSPVFKNAQKAYEGQLASADMLNKYRNNLMETAGKRFSTPETKMLQEYLEAQQGFVPGTFGEQELEPETKEQALQNYLLGMQKKRSDVTARNKTLIASNIDKTLNMINPDDLTRYAGAKGALEKFSEEARAPFGKESENYRKYKESLTRAETLGKQIRQFYGDSITPQMQARIGLLTNPATWKNNPEIAKREFNAIKDILEKETATYTEGIRNIGAYQGSASTSSNENDPLGLR